MTRVDEREIRGASESMEVTPDLIQIRILKRGRVPERHWPEDNLSKPRKKRRTQPPAPTSTQQTSTQTSQLSTHSFKIYGETAPDASQTSPTVAETSGEPLGETSTRIT
jgi:hypothetical protein